MFSKKQKNVIIDDRLKHIAFIMDGNGRWAKKRLLPRMVGHKYGAQNFKNIVKYCFEMGIESVTTYAFSTENWSRPQAEIDSIINLLKEYIEVVKQEEKVRIIFIGDKSNLPSDLARIMIEAEEITMGREKKLYIAFNYGGRAEIVNACNSLIAEGKTKVTESDISSHMYTAEAPDPDLIIRTAGEYRISNFLLWQCAYSEFYFAEVFWPDFDKKELMKAIENFYTRKRRFGGLNKDEE
ncbi:MAG: di-trans,poly-cis-decaprenylcistransferase [Clostridia bacterium]|nr:di-trans,poly-cis-decaprenylcistransferase [Clostridia bacterium]